MNTKTILTTLFLSVLVLAIPHNSFAQTTTVKRTTHFKCQRKISSDTPTQAKNRFLSEKFFCEFEYVQLKNNFIPLPTSNPARLYINIEVPAGKSSAEAIHELNSDYKLISVIPRSKYPSQPVTCEETKGDVTETRNGSYIPKPTRSNYTPIKESRVWTYIGEFKCVR